MTIKLVVFIYKTSEFDSHFRSFESTVFQTKLWRLKGISLFIFHTHDMAHR